MTTRRQNVMFIWALLGAQLLLLWTIWIIYNQATTGGF